MLRSCCERGYARARCHHAATIAADAVQFIVKSEGKVAWSLERDHYPVAVGTADAMTPATGDAVLDAQIKQYAAKLLRP